VATIKGAFPGCIVHGLHEVGIQGFRWKEVSAAIDDVEKDRRDGYDSFCVKLTQANGGDAYPDFYYGEIGDEFHLRPLDKLEVHVNQGWREAYVPGSSRRRSLDRIRDAARQYNAVASFTLPRAGALPSSPQLQGVP
jgi:hypothetical protein